MSTLKTVMQTIIKSMKVLTKEAEKMEKLIDKFEKQGSMGTKAKAKSKPGPKKRAAAKKRAPQKRQAKRSPGKDRKPTAIVAVMNIIKQSRKGVTTAQIREKTGFSERKIWDNVNRLKRQGKVKSAGRGLYTNA